MIWKDGRWVGHNDNKTTATPPPTPPSMSQATKGSSLEGACSDPKTITPKAQEIVSNKNNTKKE